MTQPNSPYPFYFAVPRNATKAAREKVPAHIARTFNVSGLIEHVRSEAGFHLYRVVAS
jgi:hypothetical protein